MRVAKINPHCFSAGEYTSINTREGRNATHSVLPIITKFRAAVRQYEFKLKRVPLNPRLARGEAVHSYDPALEGAVEVTCTATNSFTSSLSLAPLACIPILLLDALKPLVYPSVEPN